MFPACEGGATITYCTTGILVRKLMDSPALLGVSHVILDEVHEYSLELDMLLTFLKELAEIRSDFKLIVMSATMDKKLYKKHLNNCKVIDICLDTRFTVETHYLEVNMDRCYFIFNIVEHINRSEKDGAILIFVTGWPDMMTLQENCNAYNLEPENSHRLLKVRLIQWKIPLDDQKIFDPVQGPGRKVIISTPIAKTSITIPDVVFVIDTGLLFAPTFNEDQKTIEFKEDKITKVSAEQRRGRAGRVQPGVCYRLYSR